MAKPQCEDGYLKIANELADAFAQLYLSPNEWKVLWAIIRKTYGWGKKQDWISRGQLAELTGLWPSNVRAAICRLLRKNIILKDGDKVGVQKDYDKWDNRMRIALGTQRLVSKPIRQRIETYTKSASKPIPTKDNKDTYTKDNMHKESNKHEKKQNTYTALELRLAKLCGLDLHIISKKQTAMLRAAAKALQKAEVDEAQLDAFEKWWYKTDWRGKRGDIPRLDQVRNDWGKFVQSKKAKDNVQWLT